MGLQQMEWDKKQTIQLFEKRDKEREEEGEWSVRETDRCERGEAEKQIASYQENAIVLKCHEIW